MEALISLLIGITATLGLVALGLGGLVLGADLSRSAGYRGKANIPVRNMGNGSASESRRMRARPYEPSQRP
jgi:hypothetical protein